jgi:glycosyltransferase involved in cell wall biosynthesis
MDFPKLTIIIPTLKRPDTLYYTLRTVLNQTYSNYSIIVSDNFSSDNTKDVVNSFNSEKISYIVTEQRLSMSHHWEFALEHVNSGYVTVLGDDDGMLPDVLQKVALIIDKHKLPAIGWRFGNFNWRGLPPYFMIPMTNYYRIVNASLEIKKIFKESIYNTIQFPSLYGGFIDINLIKKLKHQNRGFFFHSRIPDFFSGAMVAASVEKYVRLEYPVTINATSKHSTGYATINKKNEQSAFIDLQKGDKNIPFHERLVFIRSNAVPIAEAMLQVNKLIPTFPEVDVKRVIDEIILEASVSQDAEKFEELKQGVLLIAEKNGLKDYARDLLKRIIYRPQPTTVKKKFSPISLSLYIDTTNTYINNIEDACNFAVSILPSRFFELKNEIFKYYFTFAASARYLYLKLFSETKKHL